MEEFLGAADRLLAQRRRLQLRLSDALRRLQGGVPANADTAGAAAAGAAAAGGRLEGGPCQENGLASGQQVAGEDHEELLNALHANLVGCGGATRPDKGVGGRTGSLAQTCL
jgi:hypothetical protein